MSDQLPGSPERLRRFQVGALSTNCYFLGDNFLVDPGGVTESLRDYLTGEVDRLEAILLTHTHWDHVAGIGEVLNMFPEARILCHSKEIETLSEPSEDFSPMDDDKVQYEADAPVESCELRVNGDPLSVLETPGHSPGGVSFYWEEKDVVLSGDALFKGGVGRTDIPGSDRNDLRRSLKNVLLELPDSTRVYPGHGPPSTIENEKKTNPFL